MIVRASGAQARTIWLSPLRRYHALLSISPWSLSLIVLFLFFFKEVTIHWKQIENTLKREEEEEDCIKGIIFLYFYILFILYYILYYFIFYFILSYFILYFILYFIHYIYFYILYFYIFIFLDNLSCIKCITIFYIIFKILSVIHERILFYRYKQNSKFISFCYKYIYINLFLIKKIEIIK